jgi:ligand-binding sensor domain-containing protein
MTPIQLPDRDCWLTALVADARNVWGSIQCRKEEYYGIVQYDLAARNWTRHKLDPAGARSVAITGDGNVYGMAQDGVYLYTGTEWSRVVDKVMYVMIADKQNGLWLSAPRQLWHYQNGQLASHGRPFKSNGTVYLTVDGRNRLWAAAGETLQRYDGKAWHNIGTPVKSINELHAGPDGRIWVVGSNGIAVYDPAMDK